MENIFSESDLKEIAEAVSEAEKQTNAEIKPVIINYCWGSLHKKAQSLFEKYNLHKTKNRNAVMILLVVKNRELLIYGDEGITQKVGVEFWVETKDKMIEFFRNGEFTKGMKVGIGNAGKKLSEFFPYTEDDENEISNEVIHEK